MQKISKVLFTFILTMIVGNSTVNAIGFDPVADLAAGSVSDDALLDLNLPVDLAEEVSPTMTPDTTTANSTQSQATSSPFTDTDGNFALGSGGPIEASIIQAAPAPVTLTQPVGEIVPVFYDDQSQKELSPTGPELIWLIALLLALPTGWFLRHKYTHA